jgi:release factor glutamine methyltransferase
MILIVADEYRPTISAEDVERIRRWHEDAHRGDRADTDRMFDHLGQTIVVPPHVQPINPMSDLLGRAVLTRPVPTTACWAWVPAAASTRSWPHRECHRGGRRHQPARGRGRPPQRRGQRRRLYEVAMADENYRALTAFFRQARDHLTARGRLLVFFGTTGDLAYLNRMADEERFRREVVASRDLVRDGCGWTTSRSG